MIRIEFYLLLIAHYEDDKEKNDQSAQGGMTHLEPAPPVPPPSPLLQPIIQTPVETLPPPPVPVL